MYVLVRPLGWNIERLQHPSGRTILTVTPPAVAVNESTHDKPEEDEAGTSSPSIEGVRTHSAVQIADIEDDYLVF